MLDDVVPWRFPPIQQLLYGEWLRTDFEAGRIGPPTANPDLAILLATARRDSRPLLGPPAEDLLDPIPDADLRRAVIESLPMLLEDLRGDERNVILTLTRMWMTIETGLIEPKDVAAEWALARLAQEHHDVVALARAGYLGEARDHWSDKTMEVDKAAAFLAARIAP